MSSQYTMTGTWLILALIVIVAAGGCAGCSGGADLASTLTTQAIGVSALTNACAPTPRPNQTVFPTPVVGQPAWACEPTWVNTFGNGSLVYAAFAGGNLLVAQGNSVYSVPGQTGQPVAISHSIAWGPNARFRAIAVAPRDTWGTNATYLADDVQQKIWRNDRVWDDLVAEDYTPVYLSESRQTLWALLRKDDGTMAARAYDLAAQNQGSVFLEFPVQPGARAVKLFAGRRILVLYGQALALYDMQGDLRVTAILGFSPIDQTDLFVVDDRWVVIANPGEDRLSLWEFDESNPAWPNLTWRDERTVEGAYALAYDETLRTLYVVRDDGLTAARYDSHI